MDGVVLTDHMDTMELYVKTLLTIIFNAKFMTLLHVYTSDATFATYNNNSKNI